MTDLEAILDDSRAALLAGDMARLADLADALAVAEPPSDPAALHRLRQKAERNAQLLAAALKGIRAARRRLQDLTGQGRSSTYDAQGRRGEIGAAPLPPARRL